MFTSIMGYAITGQSLEELEIRADGFTNEELLDPAVALYAQLYLRTVKNAGKEYFYGIMRDLEYRKESIWRKSAHNSTGPSSPCTG